MNRSCDKCGHPTLTVKSSNTFRHATETLSSLVKIEVEFRCPDCGQKTGQDRVLPFRDSPRKEILQPAPTPVGETKRHSARLFGSSSHGMRRPTVYFPAAYRLSENILFPTHEGNVQDGTVIDRYGNPDLLLEFAERYFELYHSIMPVGRVPNSLVEVMPALHLLVIAAELVLKACLIRDGKGEFGHSLQQLYEDLDPAHRDEIEHRYDRLTLNTNLAAVGVERPSLESILRVYDGTYGGASKVYIDSRYYAEPTTRFPQSTGLHGANLLKSHNPYPIFLPEIVRIMIATYRFYSGHERLRRLGGDVKSGSRHQGNDNHGDWGVVPSSLGLVVLGVPQRAGISAEGEKLAAFRKLVLDNPAGFRTDRMYGGNTLLFYGDCTRDYVDGLATVSGVECRLWRHHRLGMHPRDLKLLADKLERDGGLGCLSDVPALDEPVATTS